MLQIVHLRCRSFFLVVAEAEFGWKTLEYWPFVYDCSFEIIHCLSLCKFVLCLLTHPSCFAAVVEHMQSPRVGPPEPLTTPISISRNLNYGIPRVHDKWHHHALFDKYRCIPNGGTCNYSVVQSLLPILYVLVNLFSCINEDILNIISTEEAIRYSVNNKALFHLYLAPLSTTGMVTGKHIINYTVLQNNSHHSRPALKSFVSSLAARPSSAPIFIHTATDQKLGSSRRPAWKHGSFISEWTKVDRQIVCCQI